MLSPADFPHAYKSSVEAANEAAFLALYEDQIQVFDMWDEWSLSGISDWRSMAKEWFGSLGQDRLHVSFTKVDWQESASIAYLTAFVRFAAHDPSGKELRSLSERITVVLRKQAGGAWKVAHQHTSAPISSQSMGAILART